MNPNALVVQQIMHQLGYHPERIEYVTKEVDKLFELVSQYSQLDRAGVQRHAVVTRGASELTRTVTEARVSFMEFCIIVSSALAGLIIELSKISGQDRNRLGASVLSVIDAMVTFCLRRD